LDEMVLHRTDLVEQPQSSVAATARRRSFIASVTASNFKRRAEGVSGE